MFSCSKGYTFCCGGIIYTIDFNKTKYNGRTYIDIKRLIHTVETFYYTEKSVYTSHHSAGFILFDLTATMRKHVQFILDKNKDSTFLLGKTREGRRIVYHYMCVPERARTIMNDKELTFF